MRAAVNALPDVAEMSDADLLAGEKKALGFYLSSHPLSRHAGLLQALATHHAADLPSIPEKTEVDPGGNDHQREGTKREEEPVGAYPDGETDVRGSERNARRPCSGPRNLPRWRNWSRTIRSCS